MTAELKSDLGPQEYAAPSTLAEAAELLVGGDAIILAGGTDLMLQTGSGKIPYRRLLVNVRRIEEIRGASKDGDEIRIGALTTMTDIQGDELLGEMAPVLAEAANHFASSQVRNAATIGGNICNASPAGDSIPALLVLDAEVELTSWVGGATSRRRVPLKNFFTGPGSTVIESNELMTAICFPVPEQRTVARFLKSGPRPALEISIVSAAMSAFREGDTLFHVRLAFGAVGPTPIRATATEALLEGKTLDAQLIEQAVEILLGEISPIDDVRATAWYRAHLASVYLRRLLSDDD